MTDFLRRYRAAENCKECIMFFINPFSLLFELNFMPWIFGAFGFFGLFLLLKKMLLGRGV